MNNETTAELVLSRLRRLGVTLTPVGDKIRCRPGSVVPPDLLDDLRRHKPEILKHLTAGAGSERMPASADPAQARNIEKTPTEAEVLLNKLLDGSSTFGIVSKGGQDVLLWFGPFSSVTPEVRARIIRLKVDFLALIRAGYPRSRRTWGEPEPRDWREHPDVERGDSG
jgi:tubulysin polyketide synthase-like protein